MGPKLAPGRLAWLIVLVGGTFILLACGGERQQAPSLTRVDGGEGGVTVEATWVTSAHLGEVGPQYAAAFPLDRYTLVHLRLDTHSVALGGYDLAALAAKRPL